MNFLRTGCFLYDLKWKGRRRSSEMVAVAGVGFFYIYKDVHIVTR